MASIRERREEVVYLEEYVCPHLTHLSSPDMNVNGLLLPIEFTYTVPLNKDLLLGKITFSLVVNKAVQAHKFGTKVALGNGCLISIQEPGAGPLHDLLSAVPIRTNGDWASIAGNRVKELPGSRGMGVTWDVEDSLGGSQLLVPQDYTITMIIQDDLTHLISFRAMVHGYLRDR